MLQLHLSDQQFYYLLRCSLYQRFYGSLSIFWVVLARGGILLHLTLCRYVAHLCGWMYVWICLYGGVCMHVCPVSIVHLSNLYEWRCRFYHCYWNILHWSPYMVTVVTGSFYNCGNMMSSNGNIFRVTGPLCGEFTGHRWIPHTKISDVELWCFLWFAPD